MNKDLVCPRCDHFLIKINIKNGYILSCEGCHGILVGNGLLHQITESFVVGKIITSATPDAAMTCCHCNKIMISGEFNDNCPAPITASACKDCFVIFMDAYELDYLKKHFPKTHTAKRPEIVYQSVDVYIPSGPGYYKSHYYAGNIHSALKLADFIADIFD